ncbi:DUF6160 family protein [Acinetobacter sp. ANC 4648]|uniref:DUF6160 family protein n=1 Tax=Acinetobacter sp. ANC 4648 TaxID=1977875 RepID=UPI000A32F68D|nr:DUF6160 family protein [Acinetobacter sp. ANC 4648]OTG83831.1 FilA [Acinetobacter sp. ANC 4648]
MKKKNILGCVSLLLCSPLSIAMQPMDDQSLSQATGQDGINIGVQVGKIEFQQISVIDTDGLTPAATYKNKASLVMAGSTNSPVSVGFLGVSVSQPTVKMVLDADGGLGRPFANIALSLGSNITGIKVSPFSVYLAGENSTSLSGASKSIFTGSGSLNSDVSKLLTIGSTANNFAINFNNTNKPALNIQLGNVPQSHLIMLSGAIQSICGTEDGGGCPIALISGNTGATFNFQLKASDVSNGFLLNGFYAGVESDGLVFGNSGASSKFDAALNSMTLGTLNSSDGAVFNGLKNGSMGNMGAVGASVTDLKVKINGL